MAGKTYNVTAEPTILIVPEEGALRDLLKYVATLPKTLSQDVYMIIARVAFVTGYGAATDDVLGEIKEAMETTANTRDVCIKEWKKSIAKLALVETLTSVKASALEVTK